MSDRDDKLFHSYASARLTLALRFELHHAFGSFLFCLQLLDAGTVCLALARSYAVGFGLVVLLSFGFVFAFLVITPFTQTPIPGKHGVSHATSFQVNIDGGANLAW